MLGLWLSSLTCHLPGHLIEQPAHDQRGKRRQHLLDDGLGNAACCFCLGCNSPAYFLGAEQMAQNRIAFVHALGRKCLHRILHVVDMIAARQRLHEI